ncbi:MAG: PQQ-binding-like beta-propeller repeat protein, partial [Candidatus Tectomicrobia bacterium]|nr:PQQ-binding-like beta-propeller repeat protein [Candidatus Tectomicrobia bacterium]
DGTIYVGSYDFHLYAFDAKGNCKWSLPTALYMHTAPAMGMDGRLYCASDDGYLYAVESKSGLLK